MKNLERYRRSIKSEALSSVLLLICTISALCIANSSYEGIYNKIIFDNLFFRFPLNEFINDFLMFFFFLNVGLEIKENILYGNLGNSLGVSQANVKLSNKSPYSRLAPVAKNAVSYAAEAGINIRSVFGGNKKIPVIYPFARYEYYNPQEKGEKGQTMEKRCQVSMWTAGLNWYALPNLVIKADYATRQIGTNKVFGVSKSYNSENEFSIGIAYIGWFIKK